MHEAVFDHVTAYQYYQSEPGKLEILVVQGKNWNSMDSKLIFDLHYKKIGDQLDMQVTAVNSIPLTASGKLIQIRLGYTPENTYE